MYNFIEIFFSKLLWFSLLVLALLGLPFLSSYLLSYDEAHYALYGYKLAWSYFDHPPLVGWIQALMLSIGSGEWLLRLPAFLSCAIALLGVWMFLAKVRIFASYSKVQCRNQWLIAFMIYLSVPMFLLLGFALLPDTLLMALIFPLLLYTAKVAKSGNWRDYFILGILFGIAGLGKYTALLPAIGSAFYLLWVRGWRMIADWRPWLALILALAIFSPVIFWNLYNQGASFAYQLEHGLGRNWFNWQNVIIAQFGQLIAFGPLLYSLGLLSAFWIIRQRRKELYIILFFVAPGFLLFLISPAFGKFLPHWVSYMFVLLLPPVAIMLSEWWRGIVDRSKELRGKIFSFTSLRGRQMLGIIVLCLLFILSFAMSLFLRILIAGVEIRTPPYTDPRATLIGWDRTSEKIKENIREDEYIFVNNWSYASSVAWYARPHRVIVLDRRFDQFDYWYGSPSQGQSGYLVIPGFDEEHAESRLSDFTSCEKREEDIYYMGSSPAIKLSLYYCRELRKLRGDIIND